jgi:type I restriction enzyme S subunit
MEVQQHEPGEFKQTDIGLIPRDWEVVTLGDVFDIQQGKAMSPAARSKQPQYPFLRTLNVLWGRLDLSTLDQMHFTTEEISRLHLQPNDLLVCEGGEVGRTAIWKGELDVCAHQNHIHRLRTRRRDIWPQYYMYWMQAAFLQLGLYAGEGIKTTIPNLSQGRLQAFALPKPPLDEQRKIGFVLSRIQRAIEHQDRLIAVTQELQKSLLQKLYTEGLGHTKFKDTEIGSLPSCWDILSLGKTADFQYGLTTSAVDEPVGPKFLRITDIDDTGRITWDQVPYCKISSTDRQKYELNEGDLLVARIGATTGKTCIIRGKPNAVFGSYLIRILVDSTEKTVGDYLYYFTKTGAYWAQINANKEGKLKKGVSASFLKTLKIPRPSHAEQVEIAKTLMKLDYKVELEERRSAVLVQLFKTMLQKLMTGAIRVKDLDVGDYGAA